MSAKYVWICILILFVTTYFTRLLPFIFFKGDIKNKFISSTLAYLPYAVLTSMMFPEVFEQDGMGIIPAIAGFIVAVVLSYSFGCSHNCYLFIYVDKSLYWEYLNLNQKRKDLILLRSFLL